MNENKNYLNNLDATSYTNATFKNERIEQMVKDRNALLIKFGQIVNEEVFTQEGVATEIMKYSDNPDVKIIGNSHQPTLVFRNYFVYSIFVNNFQLYLSTGFKDGLVLCSINLNSCNTEEGKEEIIKNVLVNIDKLESKHLLKIERGSEGVYFSKFDAVGHPYYSSTNPQLYFNTEDAEEALNVLEGIGVENLKIV